MRALYCPDLERDSREYLPNQDQRHHLIKVCRLGDQDQILLLNGKGSKAIGRLKIFNKKEISIEVHQWEPLTSLPYEIQLVIGIPKRDALELMIKMAIEIGVSSITLVRADFSSEAMMSSERLERIAISAIEQSNNPWMPSISVIPSLGHWQISQGYEMIVLHPGGEKSPATSMASGELISTRWILLVGPEGGWSENELHSLKLKGARFVSLPTPILRAPTAMSFGLGYLMSRCRS